MIFDYMNLNNIFLIEDSLKPCWGKKGEIKQNQQATQNNLLNDYIKYGHFFAKTNSNFSL